MARVVLGVTGSVAAIRTPDLARAITAARHELCLVTTEASLHFFRTSELPAENGAVTVYRDRDEWPLGPYQRGDAVLHIELRRWADLLVVAPLDAHSLAKFALGLCDNLLSCVFRAWDFRRPVVLAPAMNTLMWDSPITRRHLQTILEDRGSVGARIDSLDDAPAAFARFAPSIILVPPQAKALACGDVGMGAMAEVASIAEIVRAVLSDQSTL